MVSRRWELTKAQMAGETLSPMPGIRGRKPRLLTGEQVRFNRAEVNRQIRLRNRAFSDHHKSTHGCIDCGEKDIRCLDFDHRDRATKLASVSSLAKQNISLERVKEEIAKCDVRCANCHRKRSYDEQHYLPLVCDGTS